MPSNVPPKLDEVVPSGERVPPVIPGAPPGGTLGETLLRGRLHPLSLVVVLVKAVRGFLIPAVLVLLTGSQATLGLMLLAFLGLHLVQALVRYFTFTYRIQGGELITSQGLLSRTERHIPLGRVQDVRMEQGLVHRLLSVMDVQIETAGGRGAEAVLSVLSRSEAERLRQAVFEAARALAPAAVGQSGIAGPAAPTEIVRRLSLRELGLLGLTSNHAASAIVILLAGWQLVDDVLPAGFRERVAAAVAGNVEHWVEEGTSGRWLVLGSVAVLGLLMGMLISIAGSIVLFHGFTLSRRGEDLHRAYGLFTRRASSLPRRRIQLLKIEEPWLRRLLRLATVRADSAGSAPTEQGGDKSGRDVLLPVARREELERLLPVFLPGLAEDPPDWRRVDRCAIRRSTKKALLLCLALAVLSLALQRHLWALWPLLLILPIYALNVQGYRHLGYALGARHFFTRKGWLARATHIVPIRNAQTVVIRQTPFDRRYGVATVVVDTAGQTYTGGGPRIRNVPRAEAETVAWTLAERASGTRYRW